MVELLRWACRLSISGTSRAGQSISGSASKRIAGERRTEARISLFVVVLMRKPCGCFLNAGMSVGNVFIVCLLERPEMLFFSVATAAPTAPDKSGTGAIDGSAMSRLIRSTRAIS